MLLVTRTLTAALVAVASASLVVAACATGRGRVEAPEAVAAVDRALEAVGGAKKLAALEALVVRGTVRHWEPEQSVKADGDPRLAGDSKFTAWRALDARAARIEWVRDLVYPAPREYRFTEIVTASAGYVEGNDTTAPVKAAQASVPPRHAMSGVRLAAAERELDRTSPRLLLEARADPAKLSRAPDESIGGVRLEVVRFAAGGPSAVTFLLLLDPRSGLPARIRTIDADPIYGDVPYDLVLEDWRDVAGVKIAHRQRYELDGREIARIVYEEVQPAPAVAAERLEIPADVRAAAPGAATQNVPYQWVLRRQHIGTYLDSDAVSFDPAASSGLRLVDLAPGVAQVVGGSHNSLVVELADRLLVVDAPVGEAQSRVVLGLLREKYPGKPVRHLVLSHHHMDHVAGARAFVAEGASVVVGAGNGAHFEKMFAARHALAPDALSQNPRKPEIVEVADHHSVGDGQRAVELYRLVNPHADGLLLAYVRDAKLGFVVDIWSPGRDVIGARLSPGQAALVAAVRARGLEPARFAGGHGSVADYAPLAAAADDR
jgi:glyoxylase-like metal-dependent hydrolase (beta-lactamase superfamily II)